MTNKSHNHFIKYFTQIKDWIDNLTYENNLHNTIYRIEDYEEHPVRGPIFVVQLVGKNMFCKLSPLQIYNDKQMLKGFSALDASNITELALKNNISNETSPETLLRKKYSISALSLKRRIKIQLRAGKEASITSVTTDDIHNSSELKENLDCDSLYQVGYDKGFNDCKRILFKIKDTKIK